MEGLDKDTRAGMAAVLSDMTEGMLELYGITVDDLQNGTAQVTDMPRGMSAVIGILTIVQGFLLDPDDENALNYLDAAAMVLEPVAYGAVGLEPINSTGSLEN